jgi:hypothetical protein
MNMLAIILTWATDTARGLPDLEELGANKIVRVNTLQLNG